MRRRSALKSRAVITSMRAGLRGRDGRRARRPGDERDLTEEVAGAERVHLAALAPHVCAALDQHEEFVTRGALVRQLCPLAEAQLVRDRGDLVELALREPAEERHALDQLDLCVLPQHRPIVRRGGRAGQGGAVELSPWPETRMR